MVAGNMWQPEQAAIMCAALRGHAAALRRAAVAQASSNRPAASMAILHCGSRAWYWVIGALEPHSSVLRLYDRGGVPELAIRPADVVALHLGTLSGDGGTALFLQGTIVGAAALRFRRSYGGDAFRLVMAQTMAPWLWAFSGFRWTVTGDWVRFADAWRRWVEVLFPAEGMLHLPPPPSVPPVRPAVLVGVVAKVVPKAVPKPPPPPQEGP